MSVSRRTVMRKFGEYVDWLVWANEIKLGISDPPNGEDFSYVIRVAKAKQEDCEDLLSEHIAALAALEQKP